jgi:hypothetical protein
MNPRSISMSMLSLLSAATLLAQPAAASPSSTIYPIYLEAAAGISRGDVDCSGTSQCDRSAGFGRLSIGHDFMPGLAAELSLGHWGRLKAAADVPGFGPVQASVRSQGVGLGLASSMAIGTDWALTVRLGVAANQSRITGSALGTTSRSSERNTSPYAGVGLRYRLSDTLSLGVQVDTTRVKAADETARLTLAGAFLRVQL